MADALFMLGYNSGILTNPFLPVLNPSWFVRELRPAGTLVVDHPGYTYNSTIPPSEGPQFGPFSPDGTRLYYSWTTYLGSEAGYFLTATWAKVKLVETASYRRIVALNLAGDRLILAGTSPVFGGAASTLYVVNSSTGAAVDDTAINQTLSPLLDPLSYWADSTTLRWIGIPRSDAAHYALLSMSAASAASPTIVGNAFNVGAILPTHHARAASGAVHVVTYAYTGEPEIGMPVWSKSTYYVTQRLIQVGQNIFVSAFGGTSGATQPANWNTGAVFGGDIYINDGTVRWQWFRAVTFVAGATRILYLPAGTSVGAHPAISGLTGLICDGVCIATDGLSLYAWMHKPGVPVTDTANGVYQIPIAGAGTYGTATKLFSFPALGMISSANSAVPIYLAGPQAIVSTNVPIGAIPPATYVPPTTTPLAVDVPPPILQPSTMLRVFSQGSAHVTGLGGRDFTVTALSASLPILQSDQIVLSANTRAALHYPDGSITELTNSADITMTELAYIAPTFQARILQELGQTWNVIQLLVGASSRFEITSATSAAFVRGTAFYVDVAADGTTTVSRVSGLVEQLLL